MSHDDRNPAPSSRRNVARAASLAAGIAMTAVACGSSGPSRADVVGAITTEAVPARYADLATQAAALDPAVTDWCESGDASAAMAAVDDTRAAWLAVSPFWFGPTSDRRSSFIVDPHPRAADIAALADGSSDTTSEIAVDATSLRELAGADQRGLGSLEIVLGDPDVAEPPDARRCDYAHGLAILVASETAALADDWVGYGSGLATDDESANVALRDILSQSLFSVQMIDDEPADDGAARLEAIRWALLGGDGHTGITELLDDETIAQLTADLDGGDPMAVEVTLTTDVVGDLGTTVNFSDADGDG